MADNETTLGELKELISNTGQGVRGAISALLFELDQLIILDPGNTELIQLRLEGQDIFDNLGNFSRAISVAGFVSPALQGDFSGTIEGVNDFLVAEISEDLARRALDFINASTNAGALEGLTPNSRAVLDGFAGTIVEALGEGFANFVQNTVDTFANELRTALADEQNAAVAASFQAVNGLAEAFNNLEASGFEGHPLQGLLFEQVIRDTLILSLAVVDQLSSFSTFQAFLNNIFPVATIDEIVGNFVQIDSTNSVTVNVSLPSDISNAETPAVGAFAVNAVAVSINLAIENATDDHADVFSEAVGPSLERFGLVDDVQFVTLTNQNSFADFNATGQSLIFSGANTAIVGSDDADIILGSVFISGGGGDDTILVQQADTTATRLVNAGSGADLVIGSSDSDILNGDSGQDELFGGGGADQLSGGRGADILVGGEGQDTFFGGDQDDTLYHNNLDKEDDDDDVDRLEGGSGDDHYIVGNGDIISDDSSDGGSIHFNGIRLTGGTSSEDEATLSDDDRIYIGAEDETYERDGANLIVTLTSGEQLTIENYTSDGQHGITLTSEEEEPDVPDNFSSPLILDLDGDGIETTNLETGGVFFDIDNDGIRERTAFVAPDDGLLALDRNGDGLISDANELFGYGETISAFNQSDLLGPGGLDINFTSGFDRLRELDENSDGFIDTNDAAYADLVVWRDLDQDGRSDDGELFSLNDVGVAAISLADQTTRQFVNGNLLTDISSFVTTEGEVRQVGDVFFRFNQFDIDFDVPVNLDPAILDLPNLSGIGAVRDLHSSIATDQGLRELVEQFDQLGLDQLDEVSGLAEQIILRWHGVDADIATAFSRTPNANAAHVAVIESISDTPFRQSLSEGPRPQAGTVLEEQFEQYHRLITTRLLLQTELGQQLFPELSLIGTDFVILGDERDSSVILERLEANAPEAVLESLPYWHAALRVLDTVFGSFEDVDEVSYISNVEDLLARQGIDISYAELIVAYVGTQNDDGIIVSRGLGGRSLRDENGSDISSVIFGGGGDDVIRAGNGQQIIYYGEGQGNDTLQLPNFTPQSLGSEPTEVRIPDLELDDLSFQRGSDSPTDLTLTIVSTGETLTIQNAFNRATGAPAAVFVLDGGIRLDFEAALSLASSTGTSLSDIIIEGDFDSDQPLNGGAGNDLLVGQEGLTEFQFDIGSGQDVIQDADGDNVLIFGSGIGPGDLIFTMDPDNPNSLIISLIGDTNDSVTILGQFGQSPTIGEIRFVDGFPPITDFSLTAGNNVLQGTNQDDVLLSEELSTDDIIAGLEGNDLLQGRAGDDRYIFRNGDGQDIIEDSGQFGQVNTLVLVDSNLNDIQFSRTGDTDEDLLVIVGSGGDQVLIVDGLLASSSNSNRSIELIEFQDGSVITLAEITELIVQADINNGDQLVDGTFSDDVITLTEGDVTVFGNDGADIITTGGGNDAIFGGSGSDIIRAGQGDDIIQTGFGRDTILYSSGDGSDTITISSLIEVNGFNMDTLVFDDLSIGDIDVSRDGVDLLLTVQGNPSDSVLIVRQLAAFNSAFSNLNAAPLIETFEFADGSTLSFEDLRDLAFRSDATDGDDTIIGTSTIDRIFLSSGSDFLSGGSANDIYVRESGVTGDTIIDDDRFDGADRLVLEEFGPDDVTVSIADNGRDFVLTLPNGSVTLVDQRTSTSTSGIEIIEFADGTLWRQTDLTAAAISVSGLDGTLTGDSGDEIITGTAASETLDGGGGNDDLSGGAGSDLYLFGVGSGNDTINDNGANSFFDIDRVQLNGLNSSDVTFARQQNNSLIITIISTGETLTITDHFDSTSAGVEFILFADGSSLDREDLVEISAFIGTAGDDAFVGTDADELIDLGTGNDTIEARGGRNTLIFEVGDGNDFIDDRFTDNDNIVVLRGVNPADVLFDVTGSFLSNVTVRYGDGDSIEIESQLAGTGQVSEIRFDDGTIITREQILEQAIFRGTEASEAINGSSRDDVFDGGAGDDVITGQRGSDTYLWGVGSGSDIITDDSGDQSANSVQIIGLSLTDLEFSRDGRDLLITIASTGETLTVTDQFNATFSDFFGVGAVVFEDGTRLDRTQIAVLAPLIGTAASDTLIGDDSADAFLGGAGDDFIDGREGSDTYIWRLGDGNDTIDERFEQQDGDVDTILLQGLTAADITLSRDNLNNIEDLLITIDASGEQIRVLSQLDEFSSNVERILFDDGSEISLLNLGEILPIEGTDGSDFIEGTRSSDLILGRRGDDVLEGAEGDDTYLYRLGDGNDIIFENQGEANAGPSSDEGPSGFDTLRLEGITQDDIEITRLLPPTVIDGVLVFEGPQAFFDRVTFDFPVAFTGPVVFEDNADFFGPVTFDGPVTFLDFADFQDVATFNDTAVFERDATFNDFVEFGVSAVFEDDVSFTTSFSFGDADISFLRNVEANEPFTFFEDDQVFTEDVVFDGPVGFFGDVEFQGTATFNGAAFFDFTATFRDDVTFNAGVEFFDENLVTFEGAHTGHGPVSGVSGRYDFRSAACGGNIDLCGDGSRQGDNAR